MKKFLYITLLFLPIVLGSCKKDKLKDEKEIFIGKWDWVYSDHDYGWCDNQQFYELLTPSTENTSFHIEFEQKGYVSFYQNQNLINEYKIKFTGFKLNQIVCDDMYHFGMDLGNTGESNFFGCIGKDSMRLNAFSDFIFPFSIGCEDYDNYFVKQ